MGEPLREATASATSLTTSPVSSPAVSSTSAESPGRVAEACERPLRPLRRDDGGELDAVKVYGLGGHRH